MCPVGTEKFHVDGQAGMTKLTVTFRIFLMRLKRTVLGEVYGMNGGEEKFMLRFIGEPAGQRPLQSTSSLSGPVLDGRIIL
jgi:hypothetical protein